MRGKHIELFLVEGVPGGVTTAEIAGWTGHVLTGPRSDLADMLARPEATRNGAYLLLGDDDEAIGSTRCYIGRTENLGKRFAEHEWTKDFWNRAVLISAKDDAFTEGHWGYLEARLVELASQAQRVSLTNGNNPQGRKLSEAQASDMEAFIEHLQIVLPVLGVNAIRTRPVPAASPAAAADSPVFSLVRRGGVDAKAQVIGEEFTMLAGSVVVGSWSGTGTADSTRRAYASYRAQHEKLIATGAIEVRGGLGYVTRDIPFTSPSTAGAVATGRSCNGRREWVWSGGMYETWENRGLDA